MRDTAFWLALVAVAILLGILNYADAKIMEDRIEKSHKLQIENIQEIK